MSRRKTTWLVVVILALVAAGAVYAYYDRIYLTEQVAAEEPEVQTAVARQGDLTISATGAGTVIAATEITLSFLTTGILKELNVTVGDTVAEGDVLAKLDDTDAQEALANAELQLRQAAFSADPTVTEAGVSLSDISVAQAQLNLATAQTALDDLLNWTPDEEEIAQAEANLNAAQAAYSAAAGQESTAGNEITISQISVDQAQRALESAQSAYNTAYDPGREWEFGIPQKATALTNERNAASSNLLRAQENLTIAQANYNSTVSSRSYSSSANARSNVLSAELALAAAQEGPTEDEIATAQTAVRQAELSLQQALINQQNDNLGLEQAQLTLEAAQRTVDNTVLTAPRAGTIMTIAANVGESAGSNFIVLADLATPMLEVYLDETDMNMVGLDYEVDVVFTALPDETFTGRVVQVDPQLVNESGVTAVRALVQLDTFNKPQNLPVGLNATVEVIGGQATNAILVPVEALRELDTDEYAVFVMENGVPKLRVVEVGLMDYTYAQILSGLETGETVTTGLVQTQ